jgi:cardiolipin synthase
MKNSLLQLPSSSWEEEHIYANDEEYFEAIFKDLASARHSIDLEMYMFELGKLGSKCVQLLLTAAKKGLRVRVMVDAIGTSEGVNKLRAKFRKSSVEFKVYHPVFGKGLLGIWGQLNRRNHRKTWIIDGTIVYTGSANISDTSLVAAPDPRAWRNVGIRVKGFEVLAIANAFWAAWENDWIKKFQILRHSPIVSLVRLNDTLRKRRLAFANFLEQIASAETRVWLGNAYFVPSSRLIRRLCRSAKRGVDVRVLVPESSDVFFMPWVTRIYYRRLLDAGVKIYEYQGAFYHAKVQIIDDTGLIGSSNLNHRSLLHDLEIDIKTAKQKSFNDLKKTFTEDFECSERVTFVTLKRHPTLKFWLARFFLLFKFWI